MIKHWAKLSCLLACSQLLAIACTTDDEDEGTTSTTNTTASGGTAGSTGTTTSASGGSSGEASGGSAGEASTTSGTTTTSGSGGSSAGAAGLGGEAGAGGAPEPDHTSDLIGIEDGEFHQGIKPDSSGYDGEQISNVTGPDSVTNGGTFTIQVTIPDATGDQTFVVAVEGDSGHFTTTATAVDGVFDIAISLNADVDVETLTVSVAPVDAEGDVGNYADVDLELIESGTGDVKVTLSFDQATDLDLLVLEPDGTQIDFDAPMSPSGGTLDLDSNPQCVIDGTNIENIFWPTGSAPEGEYIVVVGYYEACVEETVNYTVTITVGDVVTTVSGAYDAEDSFIAGEEEDSLREVARFTVD